MSANRSFDSFGSMDPHTAKEVALKVQSLPENMLESERMLHISSDSVFDDVETTADYLLVTAIADAVPETDLCADDLIWAETVPEIVARVLDAYIQRVGVNRIFQQLAVDPATHSLELQTFEAPSYPSPTSVDDALEREDVSWDSETVDMLGFESKFTVCPSDAGTGSVADECREMADCVADEILYKIPDDVIEVKDPEFELPMEVKKNGFEPSVCIAGQDTLYKEQRSVLENVLDLEIYESPYLEVGDIIVADDSAVGYEFTWKPFEITTVEQEDILSIQVPNVFYAFDITIDGRVNWIVTAEDAMVRAKI